MSAAWPPRRCSTPSWGTIYKGMATTVLLRNDTAAAAAPPPKRSSRHCPTTMRGKLLSPWRLLAETSL